MIRGFFANSIKAFFRLFGMLGKRKKLKQISKKAVAHIDKCEEVVEVKEENCKYYTYKATVMVDQKIINNVLIGEKVHGNAKKKYEVQSDVKIYWNTQENEIFDSKENLEEICKTAVVAVPGAFVILILVMGVLGRLLSVLF